MKKILIAAFVAVMCMPLFAQEKLYIVLELMKVDNEQEFAYMETEKFWKKIHQKRLEAGEIIGWDLWALLPGGEHQGYQYATATLFDSAEKMFAGSDFFTHVKAAYPDMTDDELNKKMKHTAKSRDLGVRIFMERIAYTKGELKMGVGTVAYMDFMKAAKGMYGKYEKAEMEVFQPMHQQVVDKGDKAHWALLRFMVPTGSDTYASHITVNMFENMEKAISSQNGGDMDLTEEQIKSIKDGLKTRDMKFVYLARLIEMVR